jgi:biotin operon repressor
MISLSFETGQEIILTDSDGKRLGYIRVQRANRDRARIEFDLPESIQIVKGELPSQQNAMRVLCELPKTPHSIPLDLLARELGIKAREVQAAVQWLRNEGFRINEDQQPVETLQHPGKKRLGIVYGLSVISWEKAKKQVKIYLDRFPDR